MSAGLPAIQINRCHRVPKRPWRRTTGAKPITGHMCPNAADGEAVRNRLLRRHEGMGGLVTAPQLAPKPVQTGQTRGHRRTTLAAPSAAGKPPFQAHRDADRRRCCRGRICSSMMAAGFVWLIMRSSKPPRLPPIEDLARLAPCLRHCLCRGSPESAWRSAAKIGPKTGWPLCLGKAPQVSDGGPQISVPSALRAGLPLRLFRSALPPTPHTA